MGEAIRKAAIKQAAKVDFIDASAYQVSKLSAIIKQRAADNDILIMPAAISDYTVSKTSGKISEQELTLSLTRTDDIIGSIKGPFKVGFALEQKDLLENNAREKLVKKGLHLIVANSLETLGSDNASVIMITPDDRQIEAEGTKDEVAAKIIEVTAAEFESFIYANAVCS